MKNLLGNKAEVDKSDELDVGSDKSGQGDIDLARDGTEEEAE